MGLEEGVVEIVQLQDEVGVVGLVVLEVLEVEVLALALVKTIETKMKVLEQVAVVVEE
jgi:hypothetical protein